MVGVTEVFTDLGCVGEPGAVEGGVRAFAMRFDVQRLARRVVEVGGEFSFPEVHGSAGQCAFTASSIVLIPPILTRVRQ